MYVEVDLRMDPAGLALRDPDDFGSLKVVVRDAGAGGPAALHAALEGVGYLDSRGNALLHTRSLKEMAGDLASDAGWVRSFDRMVDYARGRGWVALGGKALHAHCEWHAA